MKDAAEEIAPGAISLVDAYERVFRAMNPEARPGYPRTPLDGMTRHRLVCQPGAAQRIGQRRAETLSLSEWRIARNLA